MNKMTTAEATAFVERIEALRAQIDDVHAEIVRGYCDGFGALSVITDAVKARAAMRESADSANGLLSSFDVTETDN